MVEGKSDRHVFADAVRCRLRFTKLKNGLPLAVTVLVRHLSQSIPHHYLPPPPRPGSISSLPWYNTYYTRSISYSRCAALGLPGTISLARTSNKFVPQTAAASRLSGGEWKERLGRPYTGRAAGTEKGALGQSRPTTALRTSGQPTGVKRQRALRRTRVSWCGRESQGIVIVRRKNDCVCKMTTASYIPYRGGSCVHGGPASSPAVALLVTQQPKCNLYRKAVKQMLVRQTTKYCDDRKS